MHRSGTSLTAEWLQSCGVVISVERMLGPGPANPRGHFEDKQLLEVSARAILARYPDSKGWVVDDFQAPRLLKLIGDVQHLVDQRDNSFPVWGWKDPRSLLLLDAWRSVIPDLKVFLVWRPCHEVVSSLMRRCRSASPEHFVSISRAAAERLWLISSIEAIRWMTKHPKTSLMFPLPYIIEHDKAVAASINERFDTALQYSPISAIFDSSYLHRRAAAEDIGYQMPAEVDAVTRALNEFSCAPID
jgi:hypothetical protein